MYSKGLPLQMGIFEEAMASERLFDYMSDLTQTPFSSDIPINKRYLDEI